MGEFLAKKQKRKAKKQRQRERNYRLLAHARHIAKQHHNLTNHETANLASSLSTDRLTSDTKTPSGRHLPLQMQLEPKPTTHSDRPMPTPTAPRKTSNVNQLIPRQCSLLAQKVSPNTIHHGTGTSHPQLPKPHLSRRKKVLHPLHLLRSCPNTCHSTTTQERHREQIAQRTHLDFPPQFLELICPTHAPKTHILQAHVRRTQPTNHNPTNTEKRHTRRDRTTQHAHTPPQCDPHLRNGGEKKKTTHPAKAKGQISTKRKETKNQKCQSSKRSPEHTLLQCKNQNANLTKNPKPNLTRNRSATQLHRTKTHDANQILANIIW